MANFNMLIQVRVLAGRKVGKVLDHQVTAHNCANEKEGLEWLRDFYAIDSTWSCASIPGCTRFQVIGHHQ